MPTPPEVVDLIQKAQQAGATAQDLTGKGLTEFPAELTLLAPTLKSLTLTSNAIQGLQRVRGHRRCSARFMLGGARVVDECSGCGGTCRRVAFRLFGM